MFWETVFFIILIILIIVLVLISKKIDGGYEKRPLRIAVSSFLMSNADLKKLGAATSKKLKFKHYHQLKNEDMTKIDYSKPALITGERLTDLAIPKVVDQHIHISYCPHADLFCRKSEIIGKLGQAKWEEYVEILGKSSINDSIILENKSLDEMTKELVDKVRTLQEMRDSLY